jgi:hypothetical protein
MSDTMIRYLVDLDILGLRTSLVYLPGGEDNEITVDRAVVDDPAEFSTECKASFITGRAERGDVLSESACDNLVGVHYDALLSAIKDKLLAVGQEVAAHALMNMFYNTRPEDAARAVFPDGHPDYIGEYAFIYSRSYASFWGKLDCDNQRRFLAEAMRRYGESAVRHYRTWDKRHSE